MKFTIHLKHFNINIGKILIIYFVHIPKINPN